MLLSLAVWIGGLIVFAFVLAPTVLAVLPHGNSPALGKEQPETTG
jgi:hypothetical protein